MNRDRRHILVTGTHRSGTTWVGRTLSFPNEVELVYEPFNLDTTGYNFEYRFDHWFEFVPGSPKRKEIEKQFDRYLPQNFIEWPIKVCRETGYSLKTPLIFAKYLLLSHQRPRFLLKDPIALLSAGWLYDRYGLAVICTVRHPLPFVGSLKKQGWDFDFRNLLDQQELTEGLLSEYESEMKQSVRKSTFIERASLLWKVLNHVILHYKEAYPEWKFVKHENLASDPLQEFLALYDYLNLDFTGEVKKYIESTTSSGNPAVAASNDYQPRDAGKTIHTWKSRLTDEEIETVLEITEPVRSQLYPTDPFQ